MAIVLLIGLFTLAAALLINITGQLIGGGAWGAFQLDSDVVALLKVLAAWFVILLLYLILTISLIYTIPLIVLRNKAVVPSIGYSLRAAWRNIVGILLIIGICLAPFALGKLALSVSVLATYTIWLIGGALTLPIFATSCYCSYKTMFPSEQ